MSLATVSVDVPATGEGLVADISALVGAKTVTLTGRFSGAYTLLASHNDVNFVPVLVFNSAGVESIRLTLPDSYKSVRLRSRAAAIGPVTMSVKGASLPGENLFATLATFLTGTSGTSAVFDLATLFPPTGLEEGINLICEGGLVGNLLVEGSQDNVAFNPLGSFQGGQFHRATTLLEFTPLSTGDQVRYLRFVLQGQAASDVVLSVGGRIPAAASAGDPMPIFASANDGSSFQATGIATVALGSANLMVLGETHTVGAGGCASSLVGGANNTLTAGDSATVLLGSGNILGGGCSSSVVTGVSNNLAAGGSSNSVVSGTNNTFAGGNTSSVVLGASNALGGGDSSCVVLGANNTLGVACASSVVSGTGNTLVGSASNSVVSGSGNTLGNGSLSSVVVGSGIVVGTSNSGSVVVGSGSVGNDAAGVVLIGPGNTVGFLSAGAVSIGAGTSVGNSCEGAVTVGRATSVLSERGLAIGNGATVPGSAQGSSAIGSGAVATEASEVIFDGSQDGSDHGVLLFHALGHLNNGVDPNPDLLRFEGVAAANPLDSAMFLFYRNTAGTRVSQQVKVQAITGLLYVPV